MLRPKHPVQIIRTDLYLIVHFLIRAMTTLTTTTSPITATPTSITTTVPPITTTVTNYGGGPPGWYSVAWGWKVYPSWWPQLQSVTTTTTIPMSTAEIPATPTATTIEPKTPSAHGSSDTGDIVAVVGIGVGVGIAVLLMTGLAWHIIQRRRKKGCCSGSRNHRGKNTRTSAADSKEKIGQEEGKPSQDEARWPPYPFLASNWPPEEMPGEREPVEMSSHAYSPGPG
ncbi:hypothetical protein F4778DRAFT_493658 [Xylariomycetidae sp. FL2044]|nr:hypothetical protein F4778DRAFT_493658 [Xylariomycetidae sp. FL2044]